MSMSWELVWAFSMCAGLGLLAIDFLLPDKFRAYLDERVLNAWVKISEQNWQVISEQDAKYSLLWIQERFHSPRSWRFYVRVMMFGLVVIAAPAIFYLWAPYSAPLQLGWNTTPALIGHGIILPNIPLVILTFLVTIGLLKLSLRVRRIWFYLVILFVDVIVASYFFALSSNAYWVTEEHIALVVSGPVESYEGWVGIKSIFIAVNSHLVNPCLIEPFIRNSISSIIYTQSKYSYFYPQIGMLSASIFPTIIHLFLMIMLIISRMSEVFRAFLAFVIERLYSKKPILRALGAALFLLGAVAESLAD